MTAITHHLPEPIMIGYAAGTLPEAFNVLVAAHISLCDEARAGLAAHEAVGGALLEDLAPSALSDSALATCLDRLEDYDTANCETGTGDLPQPLWDYAGRNLADVRWRPAGLGVKQALLPTGSEARLRLLSIPAGQAVPDHSHHGTELTLVLRGAFRDKFSRFGPGDVEVCGPDHHHTPIAEPGEDCICLAATDAPLRFDGLLPRLAQPFLKI